MSVSERKFHRWPIWSPRFWGGMGIGGWWQLLRINHFRIHLSKMPWVLLISACTPGNSLLSLLQRVMYGGKIGRTKLVEPPVFVIGHWRSGTTYTQELLSLDPRFSAPTTFQTYAANHFLITQWFATRFLGWMLPKNRPMDDVEISWDSPQEDEWAMSTMGFPTPYQCVAFPENPPPWLDYVDMDNLTDKERNAWRDGLLHFLRCVTLQSGKRLVLKSPHHTGRLHVLHDLFPDARFIHISRDPYTLLPSTVRMYRAFAETQALQAAEDVDWENYVLSTGQRVYKSYLRHRSSIPENRLCEITFEELTKDAVGTLERIYKQLELGDFSSARDRVSEYVGRKRTYRKNSYQFPDEWKSDIEKYWQDYFEHFGYNRRDA